MSNPIESRWQHIAETLIDSGEDAELVWDDIRGLLALERTAERERILGFFETELAAQRAVAAGQSPELKAFIGHSTDFWAAFCANIRAQS